METTTDKPTTSTEPNKTVFVPNYPARIGQPSIIVKHGNDNIGYIYAEFDTERHEHFYYATNYSGSPVFVQKIKSLDMLKNLFIGYAEDMHHELVHGYSLPPVDPILKAKRDDDLNKLRNDKGNKEHDLNR